MIRHTVFVLVLLTSTGCGSRQEAEPPTAVIPPALSLEAPVEQSYSISSDVDESPVRRVVDVKLNRKVPVDLLHEIALKVKAKEERQHERTVIFYYLPPAFPELAGQPWATTIFNPALDVKVLGLSQEEEKMMRSMRLDHKGERIGAWLQDNQYKTLDVIYDEDGTIKIAEIGLAHERSDSDMVEMPSTLGRRFKKVRGSNLYEVDGYGNLRITNAGGQVISAAKPIR